MDLHITKNNTIKDFDIDTLTQSLITAFNCSDKDYNEHVKQIAYDILVELCQENQEEFSTTKVKETVVEYLIKYGFEKEMYKYLEL